MVGLVVELSTLVYFCLGLYLLVGSLFAIMFYKEVNYFSKKDLLNGEISGEDREWVVNNKWWVCIIVGVVYPILNLFDMLKNTVFGVINLILKLVKKEK